jgi:polysaccharide deacetylase 2 family uncharacterized protein YibQ
MGITYSEPDAVVDGEARLADPRPLERRWQEILRQARARGRLVVWMRATPLTRRWLAGALTPRLLRDVNVVPLAALIRRPAPL